jgi:predicted transcriptional regulator
MECISGVALNRDPDLQPRDLAVLMAIIGQMNHKTGRVHETTSSLARKCDLRQSNVALSISRLKKKCLIINRYDKNLCAYYMLVNPMLASVGGPKTRAIARKQFQEEWVGAMSEEYSGDDAKERAFEQFRALTAQHQDIDNQIEKEAEEQEEMAKLLAKADPKLQAYLANRRVFDAMPDAVFESKNPFDRNVPATVVLT